MSDNYIIFFGTTGLSIITYFLRDVMNDIKDLKKMTDLKEVRKMAEENKANLDLLTLDTKNKYDHILDKVEQVFDHVKDIISELKQITNKINERPNN